MLKEEKFILGERSARIWGKAEGKVNPVCPPWVPGAGSPSGVLAKAGG